METACARARNQNLFSFVGRTKLNLGKAESEPGEAQGQILQGLGHHTEVLGCGLQSNQEPKNILGIGQIYILERSLLQQGFGEE